MRVRLLDWPIVHGDRAQRVRLIRASLLEVELTGTLEQHVDDGSLRGRDQYVGHKLLIFDPTAVAADQFHLRARYAEIEWADIGGVRQVQANNLAAAGVD